MLDVREGWFATIHENGVRLLDGFNVSTNDERFINLYAILYLTSLLIF